MTPHELETAFTEAILNSGLTDEELEFALITVSIMIVAILGYFFISWVLSLIARCRVFKKAGEAGWKGIVPIYSKYIQYRLTWNTKMFWIALALIVVGEFMDGEGALGVVGALIATAGYFINNMLAAHKLSKSFGRSGFFTAGLILFEGLFMLILAFGKSQYLGNTTVEVPAVEAEKTADE